MGRVRAYAASAETVFVKRDGSTMTIRLSDDTTRAVCRAARDLKARYFIAMDAEALRSSATMETSYWGVFDMHKAQENNPTPGEWSTDDPIRTFPRDCLDAAVVYAVAMLGRR